MTTTADPTSFDQPSIPPGIPVRLAAAAPSLWRVVDRTGHVIGHLQALAQAEGVRYRARRYQAATHVFLNLGDFWRPDEAIDCLRFTR